ncbi:hypothetical protein ACWHLZ_27920 [Streptomyces chartreusis]|uniref:hypothetical protein n=1 Tax=Streptomyces chartreusis TaxID=1969 RepID=UPI00342C5401
MSTEEQATTPSGSVPNAFGNALAWKWSREMPTPLRRGFLTLLYALRAMANASGELRFHGDRQPIRIQDIARAAGCREKDARRYLDAAIRAGVVAIRGERKRGKPTLYVIFPIGWPDWKAAEDYLKSTARDPGKGSAPWREEDESSGHRGPNQIGPPRPELTEGTENEVRATAARMSSGHRGPNGSGHRGPNNPGVTQERSQEVAEVVVQPQVDGAHGTHRDPHEQPRADPADQAVDFTRCARCGDPMVPRFGRTTHAHCPPLPDAERTAS